MWPRKCYLEIDSIDLIYQQTSGSIFINKFPISEYFKSSDSLCPITSYALVQAGPELGSYLEWTDISKVKLKLNNDLEINVHSAFNASLFIQVRTKAGNPLNMLLRLTIYQEQLIIPILPATEAIIEPESPIIETLP